MPMASDENIVWLFRLMDAREDSIHNEQKRQGKLANQLFQESLMEVSALLERDGVPETRPAEAELSEPHPPLQRRPKTAYRRKDPRVGPMHPDGPGTKGLMEASFAALVEKDRRWREGKGDEGVRWLVEHASVTEEKATEALWASDFVLADAYQALMAA